MKNGPVYAFILLLSLLLPFLMVHGNETKVEKEARFLPIENSFTPGNHLNSRFPGSVSFAGKSYMTVGSPEQLRDRTVWPLRSGAETSGLVKRLYRIDNKTVSYIEAQYCYPLRFEVDQFSGGRGEQVMIDFFQEKKRVEWSRSYNNKDSEGSLDIRRGIQDSLSSIYFLRNQHLEVGKSVKIPVFASRKQWMLQANVLKKERITVPAGTFETIKIKPVMLPESDGEPKGTMTLWLSDDIHHLIIQINSEVAIGSIVMKLTSYTYGSKPDHEQK